MGRARWLEAMPYLPSTRSHSKGSPRAVKLPWCPARTGRPLPPSSCHAHSTPVTKAAKQEGKEGGEVHVVTNLLGANLPTGLAAALAAGPPGAPAVLEVDEAWLARVCCPDSATAARIAQLEPRPTGPQQRGAPGRPAVARRMSAGRSRFGSGRQRRRPPRGLGGERRATRHLGRCRAALEPRRSGLPSVRWARIVWLRPPWLRALRSWGWCPRCCCHSRWPEAVGGPGGSVLSVVFPGRRPTFGSALKVRTAARSCSPPGSICPYAWRSPVAAIRGMLPWRWPASSRLDATLHRRLRPWVLSREVAGRYATLSIGPTRARLLLAKNPAGWAEVFDMIAPAPAPLVIAINARTADGHDPSWLWDVPFELLRGRRVVATGERRLDLAVRLHYAEVEHTLEPGPVGALRAAGAPGSRRRGELHRVSSVPGAVG